MFYHNNHPMASKITMKNPVAAMEGDEEFVALRA
jgi:hypothetical protein